MSKAILKSIATKTDFIKNMCWSKDPFNKRQLEAKVKTLQEFAT